MAESRGLPEHNDGHKVMKKPPVMPKPKQPLKIESNHTTTPPGSPNNATQTPLVPPKSPKVSEEGSDGHRRPMPPPRSSSIPKPGEDADLTSGSTTTEPLPTAAHVYPSPSYSVESMNIFSSTAASPARMMCISQALSLQELVDKYSQSFPMQIKVLHGFSGQTSQLTLSTGDYYNVHFVKRQEVVSLRDQLGFTYTIPLNSALQFGLVQSEDAHLQKEYDNQVYEKVSDLLALSPLPKVACAMKDIPASEDKNAVMADEILVIKRAFKPKLLGKKSLEVLSLKTQTTKVLSPDSEGCFSLSPRRNKIYLLELVKCIPNPFPCQAHIFVANDISSTLQCISPSLLSSVVTLTGRTCETSLIASSVTYAESEDNRVPGQVGIQEAVVDIPVDERLSDVEVAIVETVDLRQQERLFDKTRDLFENFDITRVTSCYDGPNDNVYITQSLLYASTERGSESVGVQVDKPLAAYAKATSPAGTDSTRSVESEDEVLYERVPSLEGIPTLDHTPYDLQPHYAAVGQYEEPSSRMLYDAKKGSSLPTQLFQSQNQWAHYDRLPRSSPQVPTTVPAAGMQLRRSQSQEVMPTTDLPDYEDMRPLTSSLRRFLSSSVLPRIGHHRETETKLDKVVATSSALESSIRDLSKRMTQMEHQVSEVIQMSAMMKTLSEGMAALNSQFNQLRGGQSGRGREGMNTHSIDESKSNKQKKHDESHQYLEQLDMMQMEKLLDAMGLPQYKEIFHREHITGSLLLQCNEETLEKELGVEKKLHRMRLMAVISGQLSAKDLLTGVCI